MRMRLSRIVLGTACAAFLAGSTAAVASTPVPAPAASAASANSQWLTFSQMTPTGAAVLGSAGVAAAQPYDNPPPSGVSGLHVGDRDVIPWPVLGIWLAVIAAMIIIATNGDGHGHIDADFVSPQ